MHVTLITPLGEQKRKTLPAKLIAFLICQTFIFASYICKFYPRPGRLICEIHKNSVFQAKNMTLVSFTVEYTQNSSAEIHMVIAKYDWWKFDINEILSFACKVETVSPPEIIHPNAQNYFSSDCPRRQVLSTGQSQGTLISFAILLLSLVPAIHHSLFVNLLCVTKCPTQ